jgi:hypothetical protein
MAEYESWSTIYKKYSSKPMKGRRGWWSTAPLCPYREVALRGYRTRPVQVGSTVLRPLCPVKRGFLRGFSVCYTGKSTCSIFPARSLFFLRYSSQEYGTVLWLFSIYLEAAVYNCSVYMYILAVFHIFKSSSVQVFCVYVYSGCFPYTVFKSSSVQVFCVYVYSGCFPYI